MEFNNYQRDQMLDIVKYVVVIRCHHPFGNKNSDVLFVFG